MKCVEGVFIILGIIGITYAASLDLHPLSDEKIALINQKAKTWKAGRNFEVKDWELVKKMVNSVLPHQKSERILHVKPHLEDQDIPESFDARKAWPQCESLQTIWDQSNCGSSWAIAATAAMSDRICIHSNQTRQTFVSVEDVNSCCSYCGDGCNGGVPDMAWVYWHNTGIVSGGLYQANQGCKDYTLQPCEHHSSTGTRPQCSSLDNEIPPCVKACSDSSLDYDESLTFGQKPTYFRDEKQIQLEILKNGPVESSFNVMEDFPNYKSGVYQPTSTVNIGFHAVKILGWGVDDGTPYWLIANCWNTDWGEDGYVRLIRGQNLGTIESSAVAALPAV